MRNSVYEQDSFTWIDEEDCLFCLAFPAILNLKGVFSNIHSSSNIVRDDVKDVSVLCVWCLSLFFGRLNILFMQITFQFSPLSKSLNNAIPTDAVKCSSLGIELVRVFLETFEREINKSMCFKYLIYCLFNFFFLVCGPGNYSSLTPFHYDVHSNE